MISSHCQDKNYCVSHVLLKHKYSHSHTQASASLRYFPLPLKPSSIDVKLSVAVIR